MARRSVRNAAASATQIAAQTAGNLAATAIAARLLGPGRMGVFGLLAFVQVVFGVLAAGGWGAAATRFVSQLAADPTLAGAPLRRSLGQALRNSTLLLAAGMAVAGALRLWPVGPFTARQAAVLALGLVPFALSTVLTCASQAIGRFDRVMKAGCACAIVLVGGTFEILHLGLGITALLALNGMAWGLQAAILAFPLRGWIRARPAPRGARALEPMNAYARACLVMSLLDSVVWQRSEVFFLGMWATHAAIAQYVLAYGLATTAMKAVPGALVPLLVPAMAGAADREALARTFEKATWAMAILAVPTAVGIGLVAPEVVRLLYGPAYAPASGFLSALAAVGGAVMVLGYPASSVLYSTDGERAIAQVGLAVAALNVLLDLALIAPLGAWGAVIANGTAQLASLGPGLYLALLRIPGRIDLRHLAVPLAASALMALPVLALGRLPGFWGLALGIPAGVLTYGAALVGLGGLPIREARALLGRSSS